MHLFKHFEGVGAILKKNKTNLNVIENFFILKTDTLKGQVLCS